MHGPGLTLPKEHKTERFKTKVVCLGDILYGDGDGGCFFRFCNDKLCVRALKEDMGDIQALVISALLNTYIKANKVCHRNCYFVDALINTFYLLFV